MSDELFEAYVHKTVERHRPGSNLSLLTSQSLFSSNSVDPGTNLLLRILDGRLGRPADSCLDVGCGYGAIGLSLVASKLARHVEMVDRDALAVDFANRNACENGIDTAQAHASLGLLEAHRDNYGLIVSNLPGKAGTEILRHLLAASASRLTAQGQFWGVVVSPLWRDIEEILAALQVATIHVEHGPKHTAFGFRSEGAGIPETTTGSWVEAYARSEVEFVVLDRSYKVRTSRGVGEFDGLSYSTKLVLELLYLMRKRQPANAVVFNVSQGYLPIALSASGLAESMLLVDRDLLALKTAERNLSRNSLSAPPAGIHNQVNWLPPGEGRFGLVVGTLRGDEPPRALEIGVNSLSDRLEPGGTGVIAGGSTPITRMQKAVHRRRDIIIEGRNRYRGASVIAIRKER